MELRGITGVENVKKISGLQFIIEAQRFMFLLLVLLLLMPVCGNGKSYDEYHRMISTAEEYYFLQNNVDSSLFYYQRCFESFDFVFARDAVNALQIAYKERRPLEYFLQIVIEAGVTPSILSDISALTNFARDSLQKMDVMRNYKLHRSQYLNRINVECLNSIYRLGITDQISKYENKPQTSHLFKLALTYGMPGEKNCGIESLEIHKELGNGAVNFISLRDSMNEVSGRNLRYFSLNEKALYMHLPLVIMLHDYCTYKHYEKAIHEAYMGGFIHPREIGCVYDNVFRDERPTCRMMPYKGIFGLNGFVKKGLLDTKLANQLRAKWGICSIEADQKKKELSELGYKFIWDYW